MKHNATIFEGDGHQILWGDALQMLEKVLDASVDLIFADPPYNIGKNFNGRRDKWPSEAVSQGFLPAILNEIVKQSKVEFNYSEEMEAEAEEDEESGFPSE